MYKGNSSRVLPIIIILIIVAIAIAALVSVGRMIFGGSNNAKPELDQGQTALLETSLSHSVRMTVRGPIVADENFRSYQVTVDPSNRTLTTYSGYIEQPIDSKQYSNNTKAYEQFVYALSNANMEKGTALTGEKDDTRGICATGNVYEFDVLNNNMVVKHLWTSTCKGSPGSFKASVSQVENLFLSQIPDYQDLLNKIDL